MNILKKNQESKKNNRFIGSEKLFIFLTLTALLVISVAFMKPEKNTTDTEALASYTALINGVKAYTLEIAEAMPAEKYTFRPHDSVRSFGEQMAHIGLSSKFLMGLFIKGEPMPTDPEVFANIGKMEKEMGSSKEACIEIVTKAFDYIIATHNEMDAESLQETFVIPFDPNQPKFSKEKGFQFIYDHIAHHRGQALVSLRMQGIKAPPYRLY